MSNDNLILRYTNNLNPNNEVIYLITADSDLGETSIDKLVNYMDIDVIGECEIYLYGNNILIQDYYIDGDNNMGKRLFVNLSNRKPYHRLRLEIASYDPNFKLNNIELDVTYVRRKQ